MSHFSVCLNMKCADAYHKTHVTISIPCDAGDNLKYLSKFNTQVLERLGILGIRIDGRETFTACAKSNGWNLREQPQILCNSSGGKFMNQETGNASMPSRNRFKKQVSKSSVKNSQRSCNISVVPYNERVDNVLTNPLMPDRRFGCCSQVSDRLKLVDSSRLVFHDNCFNQCCSVNVSSVPCTSSSPMTALGKSQFDFGHRPPEWHLTNKQNSMNSQTFKSASLLNTFASGSDVPATSKLQEAFSADGAVNEAPNAKVTKTRQRKKTTKQCSSRNYLGQECIGTGSPFHQVTSAAFVEQPSVSAEVCDHFSQRGIISHGFVTPNSLMSPPWKQLSLAKSNINESRNLTEGLVAPEMAAKKSLGYFVNAKYKLNDDFATELADVTHSSFSAVNSDQNRATAIGAFTLSRSSSAGQSLPNGDLSNVKRSRTTARGFNKMSDSVVESNNLISENIQQNIVLQSPVSLPLHENDGLLSCASARFQPQASYGDGSSVGTLLKRENISHCVMEGLRDETLMQPLQDVLDSGKLGCVEFSNDTNQLSKETFIEDHVHLLNQSHRESCLGLQKEGLEITEILKAAPAMLTSIDDSFDEMNTCGKEVLTELQADDLSSAKEIETCIEHCEPTTAELIGSSRQQSEDTGAGCRVSENMNKTVDAESVGKEQLHPETELSVIVMEDISELSEGQSVGNISPDSAVVGDVTSVETIEENETLSLTLLDGSPPLDRCSELLCKEDAISGSRLKSANETGDMRDTNDSMSDILESNNSSEANICCESFVREPDDVNAAGFTCATDSVNNITSVSNVSPNSIALTWSGLTKNDIEIIKLNNRHSALDLAVTHFEDVSNCSRGRLSEDLRRLNALVLCEFNSLVANSSSLFCVAKVTDGENTAKPKSRIKRATKKSSGSLRRNGRHLSLYSLLAKRRMKKRSIGNISMLNKDVGRYNRCELIHIFAWCHC